MQFVEVSYWFQEMNLWFYTFNRDEEPAYLYSVCA